MKHRLIQPLSAALAAVLILAGALTARAAAEPQPLLPANTPIQIITAKSTTQRTLSWQSSAADSGSVEYRIKGKEDFDYAETTTAKIAPYVKEDTDQEIYSAHLTELKPGTTYEYRLASLDKPVTDWKEFKTEPRGLQQFKVLIFSDSQCTDYGNWGKTADAALAKHGDASFFIDLGDLTDNGQSHFQWRDWFHEGQALFEAMPIAPVLGNHEAYDINWKYTTPDVYQALFAVPDNGPENQTGMAYSFDYGNVHFAALNTDYEELKNDLPNMVTEERDWLDADLAKARRAGKQLVVLMHRPPWESAASTATIYEGRLFMPLFDKYRVSLVLDSHLHIYARTKPMTANGPASNGTVYITTGRAGDDRVDTMKGHPFDVKFLNPWNPMYLTLVVEPNDLVVTAYRQNGSVIDSTIIGTTK